MENVYIVGIVAAGIVIIVVILLLRKRITGARGTLDITQKKISAELQAAQPNADQDEKRPERK